MSRVFIFPLDKSQEKWSIVNKKSDTKIFKQKILK